MYILLNQSNNRLNCTKMHVLAKVFKLQSSLVGYHKLLEVNTNLTFQAPKGPGGLRTYR